MGLATATPHAGVAVARPRPPTRRVRSMVDPT